MHQVKRSLLLILVLTLGITIFGCSNSGSSKTTEELAAKVNDQGITKAEFDARMEEFKAYAKSQGIDFESDAHADLLGQVRDQVLESLIQEKLFQQYAAQNNIKVDQKQVTEQMDQMKNSVGKDQFAQMLKAQNMTEESLKKQIEQSLLSEAVYNKVTTDQNVTEDEISAYFNENKDSLISANVRHILILADQNASSDEVEKARAKAEEVISKLDAGEDFAALAKEYSEDTGTKDNGGVLPQHILKDDPNYVPGFVAGVWALEEGAYSKEPVRSQYGFHIIKVDKLDDSMDDLHEEIQSQLLGQKKNDKFNEFMTGLYDKAKIERLIKTDQTNGQGTDNTGQAPAESSQGDNNGGADDANK